VSLDVRVRELGKRLGEALEFIKRRGAVQASEKPYKAAESAVKTLSEVNKLPEYEIARKEGWWAKLLHKAARKLRDIYGEGAAGRVDYSV